MRSQALLLLFFISCRFLSAQSNASLNSAEIIQALKKLNTLGTVLYVAAHPDDENTRLLTYLSKEKNLRTGYLSITRGDGGQNLIGKEQGDLLGLIRTQELLAARRVDGAEQFFTRANDFGYSKTPEETLKFWNKDSVLSDVVWCIRRFKPDVIICRFPTTGEGGHGHHTASAILALEAFDAAADPKRFPEQLAHTEVWKAKRLFWNTFNFGSGNTTAPDQLKLDVGLYNPLLGKSYGEIASESRSMHKSQGFGAAKGRGASIEYFKQLKGDSVSKDLFEGIDQTWGRVYATFKFNTLVDFCIDKFSPQHPEKIIPELISLHNELKKLNETGSNTLYWKKQKLKETETLLLACAGLWLEAGASEHLGVPGNMITLTAQSIARNNTPVKLEKISWFGQGDTVTALTLKHNELYSFKHKEKLSSTLSYSNPYWLNETHGIGSFKVNDRKLIGQPENDPALNVTFHLLIGDMPLQIERKLTYKQTDPVKGEVYRPFEILPPATVTPSEKTLIFTAPGENKKITFTLRANADSLTGSFSLAAPKEWMIEIPVTNFFLKKKGDETVMEAFVTSGRDISGKLTATIRIGNESYQKGITRIDYDHIPSQFILSNADVMLVRADIKKIKTKIAYVPGAGDEVAACLKQIGYEVTILNEEQLAQTNLSAFTAILTGVRAFNTNERLATHHKKLLEYVSNGGNLIIQYNTNSRIGPLKSSLGPYPFNIGRKRVTDETAEVRFTTPAHSALNFPNKITAEDFDGWIQERGIYFAEEMDKNYETILSMNDKDDKPLDGSLIIAKHGKGNFVYTGLVFFRELPAGVPGAYRLLVNLISLPQNK